MEIKLRDPDEIQRAHDLLTGLCLDGQAQHRTGADAEVIHGLETVCSVLCWVLKHEHNTVFERLLIVTEHNLRQAGYLLRDSGRLQQREED